MRKINKIIIHCTATPEGRHHSVADVDAWHRERGFSMIGYHHLVGINGEIWKGRPLNISGAHTTGYNNNSIGVCYVGGLDANMKPKDTRTAEQKESLRKLIEELLKKYPDATVHGHNEFAAKACPGFDVGKEF